MIVSKFGAAIVGMNLSVTPKKIMKQSLKVRWILTCDGVKIMEFKHETVLLHETVDGLISPDGVYVDCTLGALVMPSIYWAN